MGMVRPEGDAGGPGAGCVLAHAQPRKKKQENQAAKPNWEQGGALLEMSREVLGWWGASWCLVGQWGTSQGTLGARLGTG